MAKARHTPGTPEGRKGNFSRGGKAGRAPGLGSRNNVGTNPGISGRDRPMMGFGQSKFRRRPVNPVPRPIPRSRPPRGPKS